MDYSPLLAIESDLVRHIRRRVARGEAVEGIAREFADWIGCDYSLVQSAIAHNSFVLSDVEPHSALIRFHYTSVH